MTQDLEGINNRVLTDAIQKIHDASLLPVKIEIQAGIVDDPSLFKPYSERDPGDKISWEYKGSITSTTPAERFLHPLVNINDIQELSKGLKGVNELDWLWVDFYIGVSIKNYEHLPPNVNQNPWDGYMLWEKIFQPINTWLS